jgi:membrane fusion protein (multidrug efflux system)
MLQLKRWLITFFSLIAIIAVLGFVKFTQIKAAIAFGESFPEASATVETIEASWSSYQPSVTLTGEARAKRTVALRTEMEGILTKVNFSSGGTVQKGQTLAQLNVDSEVAQLDAIKAEIELARLEVKRFTDLLDVRASSKEQLDRAKAQLAVNQARARGLQAQIDRKTLKAPFDGFVNIHDWQVGMYVPANTVMLTLTGQDEGLFIDFNLPQLYANIAIGTTVEVSASSIMTGYKEAKLIALNKQLNTTSRTLQARAELLNPPSVIKPGVVVSVRIPTGESKTAMPLPNSAIRYDTFGSFVFVLNKDDKGDYRASRMPVTVVSKEAETTYISEGLEAGVIVATIGSSKLRPNLLTYTSKASND